MAFIKSEVPNADLKTNAGFQSFVQHVRNVLTTVNPSILTRTSDTGQINPLTVATPLTTSNPSTMKVAGYDVYFFNDSKKPFYIKIYYGAFGISTLANNNKMDFGLRFDIGLTTDGAGNIGTILNSGTMRGTTMVTTVNTTYMNDRGIHYTYCCVKDGYFSFHFDVGSKTHNPDINQYPNITLTTESHSLIISRQGESKTYLFGITKDNNSTSDQVNANSTFTARNRDFWFFVVNLEDNNFWTYPQRTRTLTSFLPDTPPSGISDVLLKRVEVEDNKTIYKDQNLLLYYMNQFGYEQQETLLIDGVSSNFLFLTPALRATYPLMNIAIRWE